MEDSNCLLKHFSLQKRSQLAVITWCEVIFGLKEYRPCLNPILTSNPTPWLLISFPPSHTGAHILEGPLWPFLPDKAIKLFFSISPKTLSLRFNLVSGAEVGLASEPYAHLLDLQVDLTLFSQESTYKPRQGWGIQSLSVYDEFPCSANPPTWSFQHPSPSFLTKGIPT